MNFLSGKVPNKVSNKVTQGLLAAAALTGIVSLAHQAALAQAQQEALIQQEGTLAPMEDAYAFDGAAGDTMTIELQSEEFDTILMLRGPDGEILTSNDDFGGTLNSTIVIELPVDGTYSAIASSFSGAGGSYQIEVRPASEYEKVFSRAYDLSISEDFADSIEAYTAAIELNNADPAAYLGRAEARINQAYLNATVDITSPADLPKNTVDSVIEDYLEAANLLEQRGEVGPAASLREQAQYFVNESTDESPANITPDVPSAQPGAPGAESDVIPVEPDGGIGDGATPLPVAPEE